MGLFGYLLGQTQEVKSVEKPYFFDEFKLGTVFFSNGEQAKAMLNYNFVSQQMQFLNHENNNEVLNLVRQPNLTHIEIGNDIFVPAGNKGFAWVVQDGPISLLYSKKVVVQNVKSGGYGDLSPTAAGDNINSIFGVGIVYQFPPNTRTRTEERFYLMKNKKVYAATRRNYLALYSEIKPQLEQFLKEHRVDFKNEQHLRGLSKFANGLLLAK